MSEQVDRYETDFMHDGAPVLAREKHVMRSGIKLLLGMAAAMVASGPVIALTVPPHLMALGLVPLLPAAFAAGMGLMLGVLRLVVTTKHVHIQMGVSGPKIPIESIVSVQATDRPYQGYRWGVRRGLDMVWVYAAGTMPRGVLLHWKKPNGAIEKTWVTAEDPDAIVAAIERARAASGTETSAPKVRVETSEEAAAMAEVEATLRPEREQQSG